MNAHTLGYMLYRGQDSQPEFFCGYDPVTVHRGDGFSRTTYTPHFAPPKSAGTVNDPRPVLFWYQQDAFEAWAELERRGHKVEMLQVIDGWAMSERPK